MKKKCFCLFLCLISAVCLLMSACGSSDPLVGSWLTEVDVGDPSQESSGDMQEILRQFKVPLVYEFRSDGTYEISVDSKLYDEKLAVIRQALTDRLTALTQSLIETIGIDMTVEEYYLYSETSLEDTINALCADLLSLPKQLSQKGTYTAEEGKLRLAPEGTAIQPDRYEQYEISGSTLTISGSSETEQSSRYPIVFKRK